MTEVWLEIVLLTFSVLYFILQMIQIIHIQHESRKIMRTIKEDREYLKQTLTQRDLLGQDRH